MLSLLETASSNSIIGGLPHRITMSFRTKQRDFFSCLTRKLCSCSLSDGERPEGSKDERPEGSKDKRFIITFSRLMSSRSVMRDLGSMLPMSQLPTYSRQCTDKKVVRDFK